MRVHSIFLHLMRSLSEYPPEVNIACSTITQGVLPMGCETKRRYVAHVCNACMSVHRRNASSCRGPGWTKRTPMAFGNVRLRA